MDPEIQNIGNTVEEKPFKVMVKATYVRSNSLMTKTLKFKEVQSLDRKEWDSYALDEIKIGVNLDNQKDVQHLIDFLNIHKYCFRKKE